MNDRLKIGTTKSIEAIQKLRTFTADVLTVDMVIDKITALLNSLGLQLFPCLSGNSFWGQHGTDFAFVKLASVQAVPPVLRLTRDGQPITLVKEESDIEWKINVSL
jgi:hypothetical protein